MNNRPFLRPDLTAKEHLEQARRNMRLVDDPRMQLGDTQVSAATTAIAHILAAWAFPDNEDVPEDYVEIMTMESETPLMTVRMEPVPQFTKPPSAELLAAIMNKCPTSWFVTIDDEHIHRCTITPGHIGNHMCECGEYISPLTLKGRINDVIH